MHVAVDNTVIALFTKKLKWCLRNWEFVPLHVYLYWVLNHWSIAAWKWLNIYETSSTT